MGADRMSDTILRITVRELCELEGIERETIAASVEYGIAEPVAGRSPAEWVFDTTSAHWIKKAARLQRELEVDWVAVALLVDLLRQNEGLQRQLEQYRSQVERLLRQP